MARKVLFDTQYTFNPLTRTVTIPRAVPKERLVLITNLTTNTVIYNFSDPNLKATSYSIAQTNTQQVVGTIATSTTVVLNYNTTSMSSNDKLSILIDEYDEKFSPSEVYKDPVDKIRTSQPQALIDTDFEYSTQVSKWENLVRTNNRPFAFAAIGSTVGPVGGYVGIQTITSITIPQNSNQVTVVASGGTFPANGTPIIVQDVLLQIASGNFIIESGGGSSTIVYTARGINNTTTTAIFDAPKTVIFPAYPYYQAGIGTLGAVYQTTSGLAVTVTTPGNMVHGLSVGNGIAVNGITGTNPPNGNFVVASVTGPSTFTYYARAIPTGLTTSSSQVFARPQGLTLHRPFDGGVIFSPNSSSNNESMTRQTRRFFRYQAGKGVQMSTGSILKPNYLLDGLTSSGTTVTAVTKEQHNLQPGAQVTVYNANETAYNGTFTVATVIDFRTFTYTALSTPTQATASGNYFLAVTSWYGASTRLGIYEDQNGMYWEYDGQSLNVVRRNSIYQINGRSTVTFGSNFVTQTDANFATIYSKQLTPGDYVVIRGGSYKVTDIYSDTQFAISPSYRGPSSTYTVVSRTTEVRVPQSQFNLDRCDGTGPSGYNIDLSKMQMFYIDYSWYGAGTIRWGVRATDGNIIYVHKVPNNNANIQAYMRAGNLPGRYEIVSIPAATTTTGLVNPTDTFVGIGSTAGFPSSGTAVIRNVNVWEYVNYTGIGTTSLIGVRRAQSGATPALTISAGSVAGSASTTGIQIGQKVIGPFNDGTFVSAIGVGSITHSSASVISLAGVAVTYSPMGYPSAQIFPYNTTAPTVVELAYPNFGPSMSHWGSSAIMDGRFDDDKSLLFTYGQTTATTIPQGTTKALFSIRLAPSVDQGQPGGYGTREITNKIQLVLRTLDIAALTPSGVNANLLAKLVINGVNYNSQGGTTVTWNNAVNNSLAVANSSLSQIADYSLAGGNTQVYGGETTGGFFIGSGANSVDLSLVRDLGNSIQGGGYTPYPNQYIYPDGPDVLTVVVTNVGNVGTATVLGRLSWTEAQA